MTPCPVGARGCASRRLASRRHFRCAPIPLAPRATASLRSRCALKPLSPRGDGSRSARPSALQCLPTTHGDAPCARRLRSCALSAPLPCAPSARAVAAFPTPPRCPHIGRRSRPHRPRIFYLPRRGGRPTRRGALGSGPYDTRAPPRALDSDRHPAPPPPDATLPSPPLRAAGGLPVSRGLARRDADSVAHLRACRPRPPQVPVTAQAAAAAREEHGTTDPRGGEG